jgi:hypothetical protein
VHLCWWGDTSYTLEACDIKADGWGVQAVMGNRRNPLGSRTLDHVEHLRGSQASPNCTWTEGRLNYYPDSLAVTGCLIKQGVRQEGSCWRTILWDWG